MSDWALEHRILVWYLMFVTLLMGTWSYFELGREEDPSFTIKTMVIQVRWPGATVDDTLLQVTDRIEKKRLPEFLQPQAGGPGARSTTGVAKPASSECGPSA
jgi:Cu/Ag efflux pump CusA